MKRLIKLLKTQRIKKPEKSENYFEQAKSWADDLYTATISSRNRYRLAFFAMLILAVILTLGIIILLPLQRTQLVIAHENNSGYTWLSTTQPHSELPHNWQQTEGEIAHYVRARESYDPLLYQYQTKTIRLLSSAEVLNEYELSQDKKNTNSAINLLGAKGYRTVTINNILPLHHPGKHSKKQLAQVDFTTVDHLFNQTQTIKTPYTALVSWHYRGIPDSPQKLLHDWDGFEITKYVRQPVNVN